MRAGTASSVVFIGQVIGGNITNAIPSGYSVRSSVIPRARSITDLNLTNLAVGDFIRQWNGTGYTSYTNTSGGWIPSTPSLQVGEAAVIHAASDSTWFQSFPAIDPFALFATPTIGYCQECDPDQGQWATVFTVTWDNPRGAISGVAGVIELYDYGYYTGCSIPWGGHNGYAWLSDFGYQYDQGSLFSIRYRNGNVVGPLSNELPEYIQ